MKNLPLLPLRSWLKELIFFIINNSSKKSLKVMKPASYRSMHLWAFFFKWLLGLEESDHLCFV